MGLLYRDPTVLIFNRFLWPLLKLNLSSPICARLQISRVTGVQIVPLQPQPSGSNSADERIHDLQKLLSTGSFYFGWSGTKGYCDLSLGVQRAEQYDNSDPRFFWNRTLFEHLKYGSSFASISDFFYCYLFYHLRVTRYSARPRRLVDMFHNQLNNFFGGISHV